MSWVSYLSDSPARLSTIEWWLYFAVFCFTVFAALCALFAIQIGRYRGNIERQIANNELTETQKELSNTREELQAKDQRIERLVEETQQKTAQIETQQAPRKLTSIQQNQLIELLKGSPHVPTKITAVLGDGEGIRYANDLKSVLKAAEWTVDGVDQAVYTPNSPIGLFIYVKDRQAPPSGAVLLIQSLKKIGVQAQGMEKTSLAPNTIDIIVGNKP